MHFKLVIRSLFKDPFYTFLNVIGLMVGMAVAIIIFLYLQSELSYDKHFVNYDRIYRVATNFERGGKSVDQFALSGDGIGELMALTYPEIEAQTKIHFRARRALHKYENKEIYLDKILLADSNVFEIFEHDFIFGDPSTALVGPDKLVLAQSVAHRFFGSSNPIGLNIIQDKRRFEITGVFKDLPDNTHFKYEGLMSKKLDPEGVVRPKYDPVWSVGNYVYIKLHENASIENITQNLDRFTDKYGTIIENGETKKMIPIIESLSEIHFNPSLPYDLPHGNMNYIYSFFIVGGLILLLAAINYINLTTARAANRAKEIGIRKVAGASRESLRFFFLLESLMMTVFAVLLALGLVEVLFNLTSLNQILSKDLALNIFENKYLAIGVVVLTIFLGLIAGLYPAFYLSEIQPSVILKGSFKSSKSGLRMRQALVIFQFVISIGIVSLTVLMIQQIDFLRNKDIGFQKENLMTVILPNRAISEKIPVIKEKFERNKNVLGITRAGEVPGIRQNRMSIELETATEGFIPMELSFLRVGEDYLKVMKMELITGRGFDYTPTNDEEENWIVNEALVKEMAWENPIGKRIMAGEDSLGNNVYNTVIGVVKNFSISSLHEEIHPTALVYTNNPTHYMHIRIAGNDIPNTIDWLRKEWATLSSDGPLDFKFMDETFDQLYNADERQSNLLGFLSLICAIISCLGLFGLTSYTIAQRKKEIGVRKILGASILNIIQILYYDILRNVVIASLIALPITYWAYKNWLESFAYQKDISLSILVIIAIFATVIAALTISFHTLKVASENPITSLRTE